MRRQHWQDSMMAVIGVWLIASPWLLLYSDPGAVGVDLPSWNFIVVGLLLTTAGFAAIRQGGHGRNGLRWRLACG
jgi:hypothetical protein